MSYSWSDESDLSGMVPSTTVCCFCGFECDFHSQACDYCVRNGGMFEANLRQQLENNAAKHKE